MAQAQQNAGKALSASRVGNGAQVSVAATRPRSYVDYGSSSGRAPPRTNRRRHSLTDPLKHSATSPCGPIDRYRLLGFGLGGWLGSEPRMGRTVTRPRGRSDSAAPAHPDHDPTSPRVRGVGGGAGDVDQAQDAVADRFRVGKARLEPSTTQRIDTAASAPTPDDVELSAIMDRYERLGDEPPKFKLVANDMANSTAHTLDRHGPDIPLAHVPGVKTIEGRIYGEHDWRRPENQSFKWLDHSTMHEEINNYVQRHWTTIRSDLALGESPHEAVINAGHRVGHGYYNSGMYGAGPRDSQFTATSFVRLRIELVPGSDPAQPFILTAFPSGLL